MKKLGISLALAVLGPVLLGGCSSASGGTSPAITANQKIGLVSKVPMPPDQRERLIERIRRGSLK